MKFLAKRTKGGVAAALAVALFTSAGFGVGQDAQEEAGEKSKHFDAVSGHLELGGEVYIYVDVDGDCAKLADMVGGFLEMINRASGGDMPPELAALDVPGLAEQLGLTGIAALGASSMKRGDLYRNNYYLHVPDGRKGLLKIYGGDPKPFAARKLAPSGTDLLVEQDIDIKSMYNLAVDLIKEIGGPRAVMEFRRGTMERIPGTALTIEDIFQSLDTKLMIIGSVEPDNPLKLPKGIPVRIPGVNLLVSLDGLGPIFSKLVMAMPPEAKEAMFEEGDGYQKLTIPVPPELEAAFRPVIYHDTASGRVLAATSGDYLEKCLSGQSSVWDDESFALATKGFPEEGNAISFVSAEFAREYIRVYGEAMDAAAVEGEMPVGFRALVVGLMQELGLSPDHSQAAVAVNLPEGILMMGNQTVSAKQGVVAMAATAAVFAGVIFWSSADMAPMPANELETVPDFEGGDAVLPRKDFEESTRPFDPRPLEVVPGPVKPSVNLERRPNGPAFDQDPRPIEPPAPINPNGR